MILLEPKKVVHSCVLVKEPVDEIAKKLKIVMLKDLF